MDFRTYVTALRRYWWVAVLTTVLGLGAAGVAYKVTPATYASTVTFYVSAPVPKGVNPQSVNAFAQAQVNSYVVLMSSETVARTVIGRTGVDLSPTEVMKKITAEADLNTVVVTATVQDSSQPRASQLARGLAETFGKTVSRLDNARTGTATVIINVVSGPSDLGAVAPRLKVFGGLGLLAGLVLGFFLIVLRELLDNTLRSPEAVSDLVGAPAIGNIDFDSEARKAPLVLAERGGSVQAESFRQLRTNLTFIDIAHSTKVLVVTSPVAGEGKTSLCLNLALTLAETGHRVLVIEGDLRKPQVARVLGLESELGLTNVLVGHVSLEEVLQPWTSQVSVLTSGSLPPNPSELLEGKQFKQLLDDLTPHFDQILIDTPPLLPVTDAAVAATIGDGVVLVVRHAKTTRDQVAAAVSSLRAVNAEIIGVVLTMRRPRRQEKRAYRLDPPSGAPVEWSSTEQDKTGHALDSTTASPDRDGDVYVDRPARP